ncbi:MAG: TlpA family protein disulfide reductase [Gammaproteobacteria bacterium]|nr:TlpA family protein disulfide reductase [Gammaproteobacteria bacterium]MDH3535988.1 TlpA family protein disulfide reductase [Gammaproteobacteria bacterium]
MAFRSFILVLALAVTGGLAGAADSYDYALRDLDGKRYRASDYRGKWLIINFWATWCPPCIREMPELERFYRQNRSRAGVWGVTFEDTDRATILQYVERLGVSYPILGHGQDPLTGYGNVTVLPTTFVIDPEGKFFHRFEGPVGAQDIVDIIE